MDFVYIDRPCAVLDCYSTYVCLYVLVRMLKECSPVHHEPNTPAQVAAVEHVCNLVEMSGQGIKVAFGPK